VLYEQSIFELSIPQNVLGSESLFHKNFIIFFFLMIHNASIYLTGLSYK